MADIRSCEGKVTTLECMECGYREVFSEHQFKFTDGFSCHVCNNPVMPTVTRPGEKLRNRKMKKQNNNLPTTMKVNIDVSDTIKGLKAVQREAKKATQALKQIEEKTNLNPVINITVNSIENPEIVAETIKLQIEKLSKEWV